jgi:RNA polymerase sigma-70 factor (ECF subfamily)
VNRRVTLQVALRERPDIAIPGELARTFQTHHGLVFRTAYRITGNAADAEDVLQTIFLRLLRRDPTAEPLDNQESYLRRAAINVSLDLVRSRQEDRTVPLMDVPSDPIHPDAGELKAALRRALARLGPRSAEVFSLRFFEDLSNQQIARMLGISRVLVAVIVHRARQQLRRELGSYL